MPKQYKPKTNTTGMLRKPNSARIVKRPGAGQRSFQSPHYTAALDSFVALAEFSRSSRRITESTGTADAAKT